MRPLVGIAVAAAMASLVTGCAVTGEPQQVSSREVRVVDGAGLTQTFVPRGDRLSTLTVWTATFERPGVDGVLRVDVEGAGERRTALLDGRDLVDNARATFVFPPVDDAAGETFAATFTYEGREPVGLYVNPHDPYAEGALDPGGGDLAFLVGHAGRLSGTAGALARVPAEAAEIAGRDPAFVAIWIAALVATSLVGVASARRVSRRRGSP